MRKIAILLALAAAAAGGAGAQRFLPDDPLDEEPAQLNVPAALDRKPGEYYDFFLATFGKPGERHCAERVIPAQGTNTLGEVMDGAWYVNRHYRRRMTLSELVRGPGNDHPPSVDGSWEIIGAKTEGVTPGFKIRDSAGRIYMIKFDPLRNIELATAAEAVGARFFHALGYHVPETYIVYFERDRLRIAPGIKVEEGGVSRPMKKRHLEDALFGVPRDARKGYRAVACHYIEGETIGPFRYHGTRKDDPNDTVSHEHRRELRGLFVFAAWLGHNDIKCLNTCDALVRQGDIQFVRHYLIDFGASLGSDSFTTKSPRAGNDYLFRWKPMAAQIFSLGVWLPDWARAHYPEFSSAGNFEYELFDPEKWKPNYPAPIFDNRLPDDTFWAAKQVMAFTEDEIRAVVETGEYSDPGAANWLVKCLVERRNKIGRTYFSKVLPLDRFRVSEKRLEFEDLELLHGFVPERSYSVRWTRFDNVSERHTPIDGAASLNLPSEIPDAPDGSYFAARIAGPHELKTVTVYLRKSGSGANVVGVERTW